MSNQESFEKTMANVTDAQLAHNLRVWERDQAKLQRKLAYKEAKAKLWNTTMADKLKAAVNTTKYNSLKKS